MIYVHVMYMYMYMLYPVHVCPVLVHYESTAELLAMNQMETVLPFIQKLPSRL